MIWDGSSFLCHHHTCPFLVSLSPAPQSIPSFVSLHLFMPLVLAMDLWCPGGLEHGHVCVRELSELTPTLPRTLDAIEPSSGVLCPGLGCLAGCSALTPPHKNSLSQRAAF